MAETTAEEMDPRLAEEEEEAERWAHETPREAGLEGFDIDDAWKKRWVMQRDGRDFILFAGLVDLLHQVSGGEFSITTRLEQAPSAENGQTAIVHATVATGAEGRKVASGIGDANPGNVSRAMAPHAIRMAETRAKARALRDLLNVGMVAAEELGPSGPAPSSAPAGRGNGAASRPAGPAEETVTIDGRAYTRDQVYGFYTQRAKQCRDRNLAVPLPMLNRNVPLQTIVDKTQEMKRTLAQNGALAPATDGGRP